MERCRETRPPRPDRVSCSGRSRSRTYRPSVVAVNMSIPSRGTASTGASGAPRPTTKLNMGSSPATRHGVVDCGCARSRLLPRRRQLAARGIRTKDRDDLSLLLFVVWDPIGVNHTAITANEYVVLAADVLRYVQDDDAPALTNYLLDTERSAIGLYASHRDARDRRRRSSRALPRARGARAGNRSPATDKSAPN